MHRLSEAAFGDTRRTQEFIENSSARFVLTGSRYFGGYTQYSDWDYFTEWTEEIESALLAAGFRPDNEQYNDANAVTKVLQLGAVHIQLVKDAALKERIQETLQRAVPMRVFEKRIRRTVWQTAYAIALMA